VAVHFRERPLCYSSGAAPEAPALHSLTHRLDAVFTVEVALKFEACDLKSFVDRLFASTGIIDQRKSKTYVIACESDCVLESELSAQAVSS